jgi:hypothetical protein
MRRLVASVALFGTLNVVTSCVLPPPVHGIALTIDATAIVAGSAMMLTGEQAAEDSGLSTEAAGKFVLVAGVATAALTLLMYALDRPVTPKTHEKAAAKGSAAWLRLTPGGGEAPSLPGVAKAPASASWASAPASHELRMR